MSCYIEFQHSPFHRATLTSSVGSKLCSLFIYSGGGFRWTKVDVSIQVGTTLYTQTVNKGVEWTTSITLNEKFEDAVSYINVKFGDYTFSKGDFTISKATPEDQQLLKQNADRNAHLKFKYNVYTGDECCLIL
ncbi:hypothetical protein BGZ79_008563 [Entomortierella chlamydospora]|nr:hypothetical protein BGZ79_008563 [Entomortierella chlamydospora]